ncbi:MAG: hypothetical protein PHC75_06165 [Burkholderiales bacterium]|nr:hypothetical protein [Burkholderiales bacterium]
MYSTNLEKKSNASITKTSGVCSKTTNEEKPNKYEYFEAKSAYKESKLENNYAIENLKPLYQKKLMNAIAIKLSEIQASIQEFSKKDISKYLSDMLELAISTKISSNDQKSLFIKEQFNEMCDAVIYFINKFNQIQELVKDSSSSNYEHIVDKFKEALKKFKSQIKQELNCEPKEYHEMIGHIYKITSSFKNQSDKLSTIYDDMIPKDITKSETYSDLQLKPWEKHKENATFLYTKTQQYLEKIENELKRDNHLLDSELLSLVLKAAKNTQKEQNKSYDLIKNIKTPDSYYQHENQISNLIGHYKILLNPIVKAYNTHLLYHCLSEIMKDKQISPAIIKEQRSHILEAGNTYKNNPDNPNLIDMVAEIQLSFVKLVEGIESLNTDAILKAQLNSIKLIYSKFDDDIPKENNQNEMPNLELTIYHLLDSRDEYPLLNKLRESDNKTSYVINKNSTILENNKNDSKALFNILDKLKNKCYVLGSNHLPLIKVRYETAIKHLDNLLLKRSKMNEILNNSEEQEALKSGQGVLEEHISFMDAIKGQNDELLEKYRNLITMK